MELFFRVRIFLRCLVKCVGKVCLFYVGGVGIEIGFLCGFLVEKPYEYHVI